MSEVKLTKKALEEYLSELFACPVKVLRAGELGRELRPVEEELKGYGYGRPYLIVALVGGEERQVVAGLAEYFEPEELVGKSIVVVVNLVPKVIRGYKSEAMLLAAVCDGRPVLIVPEEEVPPGTPVE